jgi:hypothetical protein
VIRAALACIAVGLSAVAAPPAFAQDAPMACEGGFDGLNQMIRANAHAAASADPSVERFDDPEHATVYFITRPEHRAHPAVIRQEVDLIDEGLNVRTEGCTYGDADEFRTWFATVRARVDEIRAQLKAQRAGKAEPKPPSPRHP